jgi:ABC-type uncharacterized transport system substrate-binding protein
MDAIKLMKWLWPFIFIAWIPNSLWASQASIVLLAEKDSGALNKLYKELQLIDPKNNYFISTAKSQIDIKEDDYIILVGAKLPSYFNSKYYKNSISVLVSENQSKLLKTQTSVWVEPPLSRQLRLADLVIPGKKKMGLLVNGDAQKKALLAKLSDSDKAKLKVVDIQSTSNINQALFNVLKGTRLLLGTFDNSIYNAKNIKNILITSYRQQKVLIGPSRAYLKAGSFATTFSDLGHIAQRIIELVDHHKSTGQWLAPDYNPYYRIIFNQQVARSLNIRVMNDEILRQRLKESEL